MLLAAPSDLAAADLLTQIAAIMRPPARVWCASIPTQPTCPTDFVSYHLTCKKIGGRPISSTDTRSAPTRECVGWARTRTPPLVPTDCGRSPTRAQAGRCHGHGDFKNRTTFEAATPPLRRRRCCGGRHAATAAAACGGGNVGVSLLSWPGDQTHQSWCIGPPYARAVGVGVGVSVTVAGGPGVPLPMLEGTVIIFHALQAQGGDSRISRNFFVNGVDRGPVFWDDCADRSGFLEDFATLLVGILVESRSVASSEKDPSPRRRGSDRAQSGTVTRIRHRDRD